MRIVFLAALAACTSCATIDSAGSTDVLVELTSHWSGPTVLSTQSRVACDTVHIVRPSRSCANALTLTAERLLEIAEYAGQLANRNDTANSPQRSHALGLLELVTAVDSAALDRAVALLREATAHSTSDEVYRSDLTAALLTRYAAQQQIVDLLEAVDLSRPDTLARGMTSGLCWNHAVALAWLGLRSATAGTVQRCTTHCAKAGCSMPHIVDAGAKHGTDLRSIALDGRWTDFVWDYATKQALPRWAAAELGADTLGASAAFSELMQLHAALLTRAADSSIGSVVSQIRALPARSPRRSGLLRSHVLYGEVQSGAGNYGARSDELLLDSIRALTREGDHVRVWAGVLQANRTLVRGRTTQALRAYRELGAGRMNPQTVLGGRLAYNEALSLMALGDQIEALGRFEAAAEACVLVSRSECALAAFALASGVATLASDDERSERNVQRALEASDGPLTTFRWTVLSSLRQLAHTYDFSSTADLLRDEVVSTAEALGRPDLVIDDLLMRAWSRAKARDTAGLHRDLERLNSLHASDPSAESRDFHRADMAWIEGEYRLVSGQPGALALLDSSIALMASDTNSARQLRPRLPRAMAIAFEGDTVRALAALDSLLRVLTERATQDATMFERLRLREEALEVGVSAASLLRTTETPAQLLRALSGKTFTNVDFPPSAVDGGHLNVALRRMGDSVLVWWPDGDDWRVRARHLPSADVRRSVQSLDISALAMLYDTLIAPVVPTVPSGIRSLHIDAQGDLASVPWAALYDRSTGRYLVQSMEVLQSDDIMTASIRNTGSRLGRLLLVDAAPRNGPRALPGAFREVDRLQQIWGATAERLDAREGASRVLERLPDYDIVHFAGHAILDVRRPERSHLELPLSSDAKISGAQLSALQLRQTRLVILAACDTRGASNSGYGSLASLVSALRSAGAKQVIGAAWPIDDAATQLFMEQLHLALAEGMSPSGALRAAQLWALRSEDPALRTPRVWAAFSLVGSEE